MAGKDYRLPYRLFIEQGGIVKGFATQVAAQNFARKHIRANPRCGDVRIESGRVIVSTLSKGEGTRVWIDLTMGMKPPARMGLATP